MKLWPSFFLPFIATNKFPLSDLESIETPKKTFIKFYNQKFYLK